MVMLAPMAGMSTCIVLFAVTDTLTPFLLKPDLTRTWSNRICGRIWGRDQA